MLALLARDPNMAPSSSLGRLAHLCVRAASEFYLLAEQEGLRLEAVEEQARVMAAPAAASVTGDQEALQVPVPVPLIAGADARRKKDTRRKKEKRVRLAQSCAAPIAATQLAPVP